MGNELSRKISPLSDEEDNEGPEDLDEILIKTQENFRTGNESASKYESSPKEILRDYDEFN